ncbi:MAG: hypothetical protein A2V67_15810 [Deltaproteobacteria bacterium RBG_13_61_14]|nr:MAG: hypothetical protein A2V67_15810 [Deltaproteobacteria bacterium RBG_13_61_14]
MSTAWPKVRLGEVLREEREKIGSFDGDSLPVFGVTNIDGVTQTGIEASADKSNYFRLRPNRFVYNPYRINVGSLGLSSSEQDGIVSPAYVVFGTNERLDTQFLLYFLKSAQGNQLINFHGNRGSVRSALRFTDLSQIEIPLPPLAEQRRIVARIEALAAKINEANKLREQAAEEAEAMLSSSISTICWDSSSRVVLLGEIIGEDSLSNGKSIKPAETGDGIRCLTLSAIRKGRIDMTCTKSVPLTSIEAQPFLVRKNDVFIVRGNGSKNLCGLAGLVEKQEPKVIFPDLFIKVPLPSDQIIPEFFVAVWNSSATREVIEEKARTTSGIWKINQGHITSTSIPVPPLPEQRRIVAYLDGLQAQVDALKKLQSETAAELDALLPSILDRAFKGELC